MRMAGVNPAEKPAATRGVVGVGLERCTVAPEAAQRAAMLLMELGSGFWVGEEGVGGELGELAAAELRAQAAS